MGIKLPPIPEGFELQNGSDTSILPPIPDGFELQDGSQQRPDSMATQGVGYIKEHPYKTAFEPAIKTATGKTGFEHYDEKFGMQPFVNNADLYGNNPVMNARTIAEETIKGTAMQVGEGFTAPIAAVGGVVSKIPGVPQVAKTIVGSKFGQGVGKVMNANIGKTIGNAFNRAKSSYISDDVAPQAHKIFQDNVTNFTPEIENYARKGLKIPESAIKTIKQKGVQGIEQTREAHGNSTDPIYQRIEKGFEAKDQAVNKAYQDATSKMSPDSLINVSGTRNRSEILLKRAGYIDKDGNPTEMALNDVTENSALKRIYSFYKDLSPKKLADSPIVDSVTGKNFPSNPSTQEFQGVTPFQWNLFRGNLSKARKVDPSLSKEVTNILDSLHTDAERAGLQGISKARALARENFKAQDEIYSNALIKERKLDNYHNLSGAEKRQLGEIEKYTGTPFIEDLKSVSAGKHIDKIKEGKTIEDFVNELNTAAANPSKTNHIMKKYSDVLGFSNANKVKREVLLHRRLNWGAKGAGALALGELGHKVVTGRW